MGFPKLDAKPAGFARGLPVIRIDHADRSGSNRGFELPKALTMLET
jgi:hypothetical protein